MTANASSRSRWQHFGSVVKKKREDLGMSQTQVGELAELTPSQVGRIEKGSSGTRPETIPRLADALKMDKDILTLLAFGPEEKVTEITERVFEDSALDQIQRIAQRVPEQNRTLFVRAAESLAVAFGAPAA